MTTRRIPLASGGSVTGLWTKGSSDTAVLLAHGAGGTNQDPLLAGVAEQLGKAKISSLRMNFPYVEAGRKSPDRAPVAEAAIADAAKTLDGYRLFMGGKSFGGRMASQLVASGHLAAGLVLLSYPLHPPGKPERLRDEHLSSIACPMLFVWGSKDPFATEELLRATLAKLPNVTLHEVPGGDHSLRVRKQPYEDTVAEIGKVVAGWM